MIRDAQPLASKFAAPLRFVGMQRVLERIGSRKRSHSDTLSLLDSLVEADAAEQSAQPEPTPATWSPWRIDLMERLWGANFLLPGGTDFVHELAKPLNLNAKASVLVLGAGMGGPSNLIAEEFGAFVDGVEPDPELASASAKRAAVVEGISRVSIKNLALDDGAAFARKYDAIFGQEIMLHLDDIPELLDRCAAALKKNGKVVLTDFVRTENAEPKILESWSRREDAAGPILDESDLRTMFKKAGFRMRTVEDMTEHYLRLVLNGWVALEQSLRENASDRDVLSGMVDEAERWALRVALLKNRQLRYTRLFATKKTEF